jgi:hypothetical protein
MAKERGTKVRVSERSLVQRVNRKLAKGGEVLKAGRGRDAGEWYIVDLSLNAVVRHNVDVEALARELGALRPWESVEGKEGE